MSDFSILQHALDWQADTPFSSWIVLIYPADHSLNGRTEFWTAEGALKLLQER